MSVDIYVMPLWRRLAGDYDSGLTQIMGDRAMTVGLDGSVGRSPRRTNVRLWRRLRAAAIGSRYVRRVRAANADADVRWLDEGPSEWIGSIGFGGSEVIAFAAYLAARDRFERFEPAPEDNYYRHPALSFCYDNGVALGIPHLQACGMYSGHLYPSDFLHPAVIQEYQVHAWKFKRSAGSAPRAREELEMLRKALEAGGHFAPRDEGLRESVLSIVHIVTLAVDKAIARKLPVIFCG